MEVNRTIPPKWTKRFKIKLLIRIGIIAVILLVATMSLGLWVSSNMLLSPSFKGVTKDFSHCLPDTERYFGESCGNLRQTKEYSFQEVKFFSVNGYVLPGWLIRAEDNGGPPSNSAIMFVHAGGSDRREGTKYIGMYHRLGMDVLTFDLSCHGEAPCITSGLSFGERESTDVLSAYHYLKDQYDKVYAMGSSVGASSILIALPEMPDLESVIAENPYSSFEQLIMDAPESKSLPDWAVNNLIQLTKIRGKFDGQSSPENSLRLSSSVPIFFIHSKADHNTPYTQTEYLEGIYTGPKTLWEPKQGEHSAIWNTNRTDYEKRIKEFLK
ncbi:alpha/beta hydrolase [Alteribacillus bidgolensis]|uniref:Serine aminopeptidase S33 domain-containing protein n=1 Tax=Alteribacillus bidgolensis TaxID=930129 RepID=A0A1G8RN63_9BACI|nr:hypothetical protein [Alteribacillus bidgolensis]SDJ17925.1 hypothetical protein SAMN05216352_12916 [Alteribacillus bidgolensis]